MHYLLKTDFYPFTPSLGTSGLDAKCNSQVKVVGNYQKRHCWIWSFRGFVDNTVGKIENNTSLYKSCHPPDAANMYLPLHL